MGTPDSRMISRVTSLSGQRTATVDRPPVGFWFHFPEEKQLGQPCIDAHLDYYNHVDADIAKLMWYGYFDYPNPGAKRVKEPEDWYALKPLGDSSDFIRGQVARAKAVKEGLTSGCLVLYNVFAPFSTLRFGTSDELVMEVLDLKQVSKQNKPVWRIVARVAAMAAAVAIVDMMLDDGKECP